MAGSNIHPGLADVHRSDHERHAAALLALTRQSLLDRPDSELDLGSFARLVAETLDVRRASLWRLGADSRSLNREFLHDALETAEPGPVKLDVDAAPAYFRALSENRPVVADKAQHDPRTCELAGPYLKQLGITSILDTPIFIAGQLAGVLCLEHVGPSRSWAPAEQSFAVAAANLVALMIAQRARARSESRLRTILDSEPECVKTVSIDGALLTMNAAGLRMIDAAKIAEVRGIQVADLVHPEDRSAFLDLHSRVSRGATDRLSFRLRGRKGKERWVQTTATPLRRADGGIDSVLSVTRDVTDELRAQRALRERIKELHCLYRVLELTTEDRRQASAIANDIAALLPGSLRFPEHAVACVSIGEVEHRSPDWSEPVMQLRRPVVVDDKAVGFVEFGYRARPEPSLSPEQWFLDEEAALLDAVAIHLGRMMADRRNTTLLRQAERLRAIGELTGGIAHDFNNLLQVILGTTDQLAEALAADQRLGKLAELARSAAGRGAELTGRLLAFARQQALDPRPVDAAALLEGMTGLVRRAVGAQVKLDLSSEPALWPAMADAAQLENAVLNLCLNARDAMSAGGLLSIELSNVTLDVDYVRQHSEIEPGDYVMITVSDTGCGMPPEVLARAFDPFFTTKDGGGSGLGLSMVYGFAKQSRGHVRIYSEPGHGTTVRLYLPRAPAEPVPERPAPSRTDIPLGREHVLLVEDDELVRSHVLAMMETLGYSVTPAGSGSEALALLQENRPFDLLFTDIVMPGPLNGQQLAERARALRPDLPVLFTSGYTESTISSRGWLRPGVLLLNKPYRRLELAMKLREALGNRSTAAD